MTRIMLAQLDCAPGDVGTNVAAMRDVHAAAAAAGCDLVVLPEMSDTGYDLSRVRAVAGRARGAVREMSAAEPGLLAGISETQGGRVRNTLTWFAEGQERAVYRKRHLIGLLGEPEVVTAGRESVVAGIGDAVWGLMVCYDLRFPEQARELVLVHGAEVLCYVAAWPTARIGHWLALLRARAIENQCVVIGVNRAGCDAGVEFGGRSVVFDAMGEELCRGGEEPERLIVDIDVESVRATRRRLPFLLDA